MTNPAETVVSLEPGSLLAGSQQETRFGFSPAGRPDPGRCQAVGLALMSSEAGAAMRLVSMTLEMGEAQLATHGPALEAFVRVDKRGRSLAFLTVETRLQGVLIFRGHALFRAASP